MASGVQLGDSVRFCVGMAPEALKGREAALGVVTALVPFGSPELWPVVQFDGFKTSVLQPGLLEVVGDTSPARDDPEMANKVDQCVDPSGYTHIG